MRDYDSHDWYWIVGNDDTQVYSSARAGFVPVSDEKFASWQMRGNSPDPVATIDNVVSAMRASKVPPYHAVPTFLIVQRLEAAGLIEQADAALTQNKTLWRRFYTIGEISADNADARAFLAAIGANPDQILAP